MTYTVSEEVLAGWAEEISLYADRIGTLLGDVERVGVGAAKDGKTAANIHMHCMMASCDLENLSDLAVRIGNFQPGNLPFPIQMMP